MFGWGCLLILVKSRTALRVLTRMSLPVCMTNDGAHGISRDSVLYWPEYKNAFAGRAPPEKASESSGAPSIVPKVG